ncbi:hypothetical protein RBB50_002167 [Rhinocladiella similis]
MDHSTPANAQQLGISGFRDDALREYTEGQQSKVRDLLLEAEFTKAHDATPERWLRSGRDL